jgi:4-hydroxy-tetrahydrodipicolinate reductase
VNIIIAGYGKMGHEIEKIALLRGHSIIGIYQNKEDWNNTPLPQCDVVLEFTTPETAPEIINYCFDKKIPVISGTTGWNDKLTEIKEKATKEGRTFLYASNFSIGVNILFQINQKLASLFCGMEDYTVNIHETHHIHKKDTPSGTAITLAEGINRTCERYESWVLNKSEEKKIPITSERIGEVPGTHIVEWNSRYDSVQLIHTAHNRTGFALGAVLAAEWLQGKSGVFSMHDLFNETLEK